MTLIESGASRETSAEIMEAIQYFAAGSLAYAEQMWLEPTHAEVLAIWERVTKNGLLPSANFVWGAAAEHWASEFGVEG